MTEIPGLVQDQIWWYGWRDRMMKLNEDFRKNTSFDEIFLYFTPDFTDFGTTHILDLLFSNFYLSLF